jgi:hypothetical protein
VKEQFLSEEQLRNIVAKGTSDKMRRRAETLLAQIDEVRSEGGIPVCVLKEDGTAFVFDNTEAMGN